ncbi:MAG: hypothetical protein IJS14_02290 [Lentisphaeria bacterium]|nr:hypothetical protein [Lentisphaeria bacterium]
MKDLFIHIGYLLLALLEGVLYLVFWLFIGLPVLLWEKRSYEAQTLRYSGGGWGRSMKEGARTGRNRPNKP